MDSCLVDFNKAVAYKGVISFTSRVSLGFSMVCKHTGIGDVNGRSSTSTH
jgi:hypothetical protein